MHTEDLCIETQPPPQNGAIIESVEIEIAPEHAASDSSAASPAPGGPSPSSRPPAYTLTGNVTTNR